MKLSDWARQQGISDITAWRWFRAGKLPVPARQLPTGTIWVEAPHREGIPVRYARVSSADQKNERNFYRSCGIPRWFGFDWLEAAMAASGRHVVVIEEGEVTDDLAQDVLEILTSACGRLDGRRSARNRARRALEAMGCG